MAATAVGRVKARNDSMKRRRAGAAVVAAGVAGARGAGAATAPLTSIGPRPCAGSRTSRRSFANSWIACARPRTNPSSTSSWPIAPADPRARHPKRPRPDLSLRPLPGRLRRKGRGSRSPASLPFPKKRLHPFASEPVGPLVFRMARMAAHPDPLDAVARLRRLQLLPEIDVLYRLVVRGAPAARFPAWQPLPNSISQVSAVGVKTHDGRLLERFQRTNRRRHFHPVVGGHGFAAHQLPLMLVPAHQHAPAAGTGIPAAGPIGEDIDDRLIPARAGHGSRP